jgi:hypothetical protein
MCFPDERYVTIKESDKLSLLINISMEDTPDFKALISNDSLFIPHQIWKDYGGTQASFRGEGEIRGGSLFLHYEEVGTFGLMECDCKRKQVK